MAQAKERAPCNYSAPSSVGALEPPWRARSGVALGETFTAAFQRPQSAVACGEQRWVSLWAWSEPGHHPEPLKTFSQQINNKKRSRQSGNGVFASLLFACSAHSPSFANPDQVVFRVLLPVLCCLFLFFVPIHIGDLGPVFRLAHRHAHPTAFPKYLILCPPILAFDSASSHFPILYIFISTYFLSPGYFNRFKSVLCLHLAVLPLQKRPVVVCLRSRVLGRRPTRAALCSQRNSHILCN